MSSTVFVEIEFWLLVVLSIVAPIAIYWTLFKLRAVSKITVLVLGLALVLIAGIDVYLLKILTAETRLTSSLVDDAVFLSELSIGLYLFPALFGGIGVNVVSHVLIRHLGEAERQFEKEHPDA